MNPARITQGMILAAGRGERMRPLTDTLPKPLIPVAGRTMLDRAIDALEAQGVTRIVVNCCYLAERIIAHLQTRLRGSAEIILSHETTALETGGGILHALPHFGDAPFFCINGDIVWTDYETPLLTRLQTRWHTSPTPLGALLALYPVQDALGYDGNGDFFMTETGALTRRSTAPAAPYVYAAVQVLHARLFAAATPGVFSLNRLYDEALRAQPPMLVGLMHQGRWMHIGDPVGLAQAEKALAL